MGELDRDERRRIAAKAMSLPQDARDRLIDLAEEAEAIAEREVVEIANCRCCNDACMPLRNGLCPGCWRGPGDIINESYAWSRLERAVLQKMAASITDHLCKIQISVEEIYTWFVERDVCGNVRMRKLLETSADVYRVYYELLEKVEKMERMLAADCVCEE